MSPFFRESGNAFLAVLSHARNDVYVDSSFECFPKSHPIDLIKQRLCETNHSPAHLPKATHVSADVCLECFVTEHLIDEAKVIARALRDAGMEVIYTGLRRSPDMIAAAALQEDVDPVGVSRPLRKLKDMRTKKEKLCHLLDSQRNLINLLIKTQVRPRSTLLAAFLLLVIKTVSLFAPKIFNRFACAFSIGCLRH